MISNQETLNLSPCMAIYDIVVQKDNMLRQTNEQSSPLILFTLPRLKKVVFANIVTPGNVHDSNMLEPLVQKIISEVGLPVVVAADAAYKTPAIANYLLENQILPEFPYKRPMTRDVFFRKHEYVYDEHFDCYLCPEGQELTYRTTMKEGYRQYASTPSICATCPVIGQCTHSKNQQKMFQWHIWQDYLDVAEDLRHNHLIEGDMEYAKRRFSASLLMQKKSMTCDDPSGT